MRVLNKMRYLIVGSVALLIWACTPTVNIEQERKDVEKVIDQYDQAMKTEDLKLLSSIFAHDPHIVVFGTDETERWVGFDTFKKAAKEQFDVFDTREFVVRDKVIGVHPSGEVAWFSKIIDWKIKVKDRVFEAYDLRYTGVLEKRHGKWVFVQCHVSAPLEGQLVEY